MMRKLAPYTRGYRIWIVLGVLCSAGEAVLELLLPKLMSNIVDVGIAGGDRAYILATGTKMVLSSRAGMGFGANLRLAEYTQVQKFSFSNIEHFSTASLITRLTNDVSSVQMMLMMGMRMLVRAPVMLITAVIMALRISLRLSQVFLVIVPLLIVAVALVIKFVGPIFNSLQRATDDLNLVVQEDLSAIRVVKSFVREDREREKFAARSDNLRATAERAYGFVVMFFPVVTVLMGATIVSIMWIGGNDVFAGTMLSGDLLAFFTYASEILMSLMMLSMVFLQSSRAMASVKRINEVMDTEIDLTDTDAARKDAHVTKGGVEFKDVCFSYGQAGDYVLEHINLQVNGGETVGIIGSTGSGKTSLVQLIPRLYDATSGQVLIDGIDVRDYSLKNLREGGGMVLQKNILFSGTIEENLKWGDEEAGMETVREAAKSAQADEFVTSFVHGYDTEMGQGGVNVSGGQKQRLCIARALLKKPRILILDDSTSAVDTATEAQIRKAFRTSLKDTTKFIIAQRISSVEDADKIIVLDDGKIIGMGTHNELLGSCEAYREIYETQYGRNSGDEEDGGNAPQAAAGAKDGQEVLA